MTEQEIIKLTNQVFEESFEIEKDLLKEEMNIFQDLGLDSLDIVDLVVALQEKGHKNAWRYIQIHYLP